MTNLHGTHISSLDYFQWMRIAKLYNVEAIPATFILDEKWVIIAKELKRSRVGIKNIRTFEVKQYFINIIRPVSF